MKKATTSVVPGKVDRFAATKARRKERRAKGLCVFCGAPLPDPNQRKREAIERKIASLREQVRQLSIPAPPKPVAPRPEDEDVPLAVAVRKRH